MTTDTAWLVGAGLVLLGVGLAWLIVKGRMRGDDKPTPPSAPAEVEAEPAVASVPVAAPARQIVSPPVAAPPPPRVAPPPPPPAPAPAPPPPPRVAPPSLPDEPVPVTMIMAPARVPVPVIEHVLGLEPADPAEWDAAVPMPLTAAQAASLASSLATGGNLGLYAIGFEAGATIAVGRGNQAFMRTLAAKASAGSRRWLDSTAAAALAATALAGLANERFLEALGDEVRELKTQLAALSPKLGAPGDGRLKTLVQDLSRFAREARDNYASALGKAAFRERVDEAGERALSIWRDLVERVDAVRQQLGHLAGAQRFGEVQVEKALAQLRELIDLERWQEVAARSLAAAQVLRVVMGEVPARGAADPLASAIAALQAGIDQDRALALHLSDCEKSARGDPYVGRGEFEANRAALRKLIGRPVAEQAAPALERLEAARVAEALDPSGAPARRLLIRSSGDACAMRWSASDPA